ncbi:hypothetical protein Clacol_004259 [Clathrus columnatus]|uniref:Hamartin n=1 Tax=Clathrus columnatus TaxID=1419009 RepID=A0AAV5ABM3_9AGAM|nr:hypothetical protein Clacol_004259 [Clathrus columnatus]
MSSSDISKRIRTALSNDFSEKLFTDSLNSISSFVIQQSPPDSVAVLDQLRDDLQSIYRDLVDHSSSTKLERFIAILHSFLPIFRPIYVVTHWWDLVLRAALRNPRLSGKALQQVKDITLHGLILESSKVTEFRKRMIELFLLDAYDESSGCDALEQATMSAEERRILHFWKQNLGDLLEQLSIERPTEFLDEVHIFFASSQSRLKLAILLGVILRSEHFPVQKFAVHPLLDSLLLSLIVDGSSTLFEVEIAILSALLPHFAVHAPDTLIRILPYCYAILARVICWKPRSYSNDFIETDTAQSDSNSSQSQVSEREMDPADTQVPVSKDLEWERLAATFVSSVSEPPSPLPLFNTLYGLYPCNTLAFLKDPISYITKSKLVSPFIPDWPNILDEDQIRTRARALLRHNILHTSLLTHTAESELEEQNHRWADWDVPRIAMMCTMLDVRNSALSLRRMPDALYLPDSFDMPTENVFPPSTAASSTSFTTSRSSGDSTPHQDERVSTDLRAVDFSIIGRPRVSVQDIIATYHALKSGIEIDIIDPTPEWPQRLFPNVTSPSQPSLVDTASTPDGGNNHAGTPSISDEESLPPHVQKALAKLQRENLLLRTELNYELWLKREIVKRIGHLYTDRILVKGAELERQTLHHKIKEYKAQIQQLQKALSREQAGANTTKTQHADYTRRLQERLKAEKAEKQLWAEEKSRMQSEYQNLKAMLTAQANRLAEATARVFELETQNKENKPKIDRLQDYEDKINQLLKGQRLWDDDVRRLKEKETYLEDIRIRYRNKLLLIESYKEANKELVSTIESLKTKISVLETTIARRNPPHSGQALSESLSYHGITRMIEDMKLQMTLLTSERDQLLERNEQLGDQLEESRITVESLRSSLPLNMQAE